MATLCDMLIIIISGLVGGAVGSYIYKKIFVKKKKP
jgi:uncharacterized protein YneF (UPF0154 family)